MEEISEHILLLQLKEGDQNSFRELYDRYHAALYRNVMRLLHDGSEAQDVVQEVFVRLWENRDSLDLSRPVNSWLFTVSYNRAVNLLRKKLLEKQRSPLIAELATDVSNIQDERLIEAQWRLMQDAIDQLSPKKRRVFELCKLEGKTYEMAAKELGISRHTVGEYLQESMAFVRDYVRRHPYYSSSSLAILVLEIFFQ